MKKIAILTSGGDAPGMNTAIYEICKYAKLNNILVFGIKQGYYGLLNNKFIYLNKKNTKIYENIGGTFLKSSRFTEFKNINIQKIALNNIKKKQIDVLFVIGGDGSYQGAKHLSLLGLQTICLPGTIDNNIYNTDYTIGFFTALETICNLIEKIKDTALSHNRIFIIEIMGGKSGELTKYAGISTGANIIITPKNMPINQENLLNKISKKIKKNKSFIILITEKLINIKDLAVNLSTKLNREVKTVILGHPQRGGSPNYLDKILARRLAKYGINYILKSKKSKNIGILNNKIYNY